MHRKLLVAMVCLAWLCGCAAPPQRTGPVEWRQQVVATETAFAKTMADRDYAAFTSYLSDEALFLGGPTPLRGKQQVAAAWKRYYEKPAPPFSWRPDKVEVVESGGLAFSSGPVFDPAGKLVGSFTSIWRQEAPGVWRIVFDTGDSACDRPKE